MMMKVFKELMVSTDEYEDRNTGKKKKRWSKVGCVFQDDQDPSKMSMVLEVMPLPKLDKNGYPKVSIAMFDPKPYEPPAPQHQPIQTPAPQHQQQYQPPQQGYDQSYQPPQHYQG